MNAVELENVGKRYSLGEGAYRYSTLREDLGTLIARRRGEGEAGKEIWALRDLTLEIPEGQPVGVIGRNGAGKTTLLKILARITHPTSGVSRTRGRVGCLLEVGTGFHPELTGRENIFLNGALIGMSRREISRRFDEIVEFAGVERFLDTPLKRYSSGMSLRLAFAVAASLEPEIVVVDEVLAVGDAEFQRKCLGRMSALAGEGRTVVLVSHDLGAVAQLCERTVWLDRGTVQADGPAAEVVDSYVDSALGRVTAVSFAPEPGEQVQLLSVALTDEAGLPKEAPHRDEPLTFRIRFATRRRTPALDLGVYLLDRRGTTVVYENWSDVRDRAETADEPGEYEAVVTIPPVLPAAEYVACVWLGRVIGYPDFETFVDREALTFELLPRPDDIRDSVERNRLVQPPVSWEVRRRVPVGGAPGSDG